MSNVLVVGEIKDGQLKKISKEVTSTGKKNSFPAWWTERHSPHRRRF